MLARLQAEEETRLLNALVAAGGRGLDDKALDRHTRELDRRVSGRRSRIPRAKRLTAALARKWGFDIKSGEEVNDKA